MSALLDKELQSCLQDLSQVEGLQAAMVVTRNGARMVQESAWKSSDPLSEIHDASFNMLQERYGKHAHVVVNYEKQVLGVYALGHKVALVALSPDSDTEEKVRQRWREKSEAWMQRFGTYFGDVAKSAKPLSPPGTSKKETATKSASGSAQDWAQNLAQEVADEMGDGLNSSASEPLADPSVDTSPAISVLGGGGDEELKSLLSEAKACFVEFSTKASAGMKAKAGAKDKEEEFEARVKDWSSYCEPDVFSFPMLLDTLSQGLGDDLSHRADFMAKMQSILARYMG